MRVRLVRPLAVTLALACAALAAGPGTRAAPKPNPEKTRANPPKVRTDQPPLSWGPLGRTTHLVIMEKQVFDLTNAERAKEQLPLLKPDLRLVKAARGHSANMARQNKMDHVLDGKNPIDRLKAVGYPHAWMGENVAWGQRTPADALRMWMNSEPHKANILDERFTELGVGIAFSENGYFYYTQVFGTPKRK
jgi:uncharacterized protein YkwD